MIKVAGTLKNGGKFVALGLSDENWRRLREGQPIIVHLQGIDARLPDLSVLLLGGDTEASLVDDLRSTGMWPTGIADQETGR